MARDRSELHSELVSILGSEHVYFQPPENYKLSYPCIIYEIKEPDLLRADDALYSFKNCYQITIIDRNPDGDIWKSILAFPLCSFNRFYTVDNLNHYVLTLYY